MMLLDVTVNINLDSATLVRERALDIILRADRFVSDLTDHREFLIQTCKDAIGAISRCIPVLQLPVCATLCATQVLGSLRSSMRKSAGDIA